MIIAPSPVNYFFIKIFHYMKEDNRQGGKKRTGDQRENINEVKETGRKAMMMMMCHHQSF